MTSGLTLLEVRKSPSGWDELPHGISNANSSSLVPSTHTAEMHTAGFIHILVHTLSQSRNKLERKNLGMGKEMMRKSGSTAIYFS